ncbi:EF-P 5-aminopentanol modification-associated protein YfmH [Gorillibacterium sp. sgz5001074]|uniref:EF-P 5-aminopentanol modification-associated protein YfmH n=1 Tax=Gorillibacterium sp. sgz5001074 TaxID=3446695 RepID=UPI003F66702D
MEAKKVEHLNETLYTETLPNGLKVFILPKPGFQKTYATFSTRYGSVDNHFQVPGKEPVKVPDGIAHFLEHKMFEEPEGDVFARFASKGASANAFTSFDRTVYLFSATEYLTDNLTTLINFVQNPYFTDENVEKEKGIIGQEIKMYRDNPDWRVYFGLIEALYQVHPVHIDIAGTVDSIAEITKETLYECYHTFYHPENMMIFVVGGVDPEQVMELIRSNQAAKSFAPQGEIKRFFEAEPAEVRQKHRVAELPVSLPKVMIGFKEAPSGKKGQEQLKLELATKVMLDCLFSPSSALYQELYDDNLISDSFGSEFNLASDYSFSVVGGDTRDPDELIARIKSALENMKQSGIPAETFERSRRKKLGGFLRLMNSPESLANEFTKYAFRDTDLFESSQVYESLTLNDVNARLKEHFDWERMSVSIVRSGGQA